MNHLKSIAETSMPFRKQCERLAILPVPFGGGQAKIGVDRGPVSMLAAGLVQKVSARCPDIDVYLDNSLRQWKIDAEASLPVQPYRSPVVNNLHAVAGLNSTLSTLISKHIAHGRSTLTLGGDHSIALGSISGVAHAVQPNALSVIWVDAHADLNTPNSSPSHNAHGMPLAFLTGLVDQSSSMSDRMFNGLSRATRLILPSQIVYIGLRSLNDAEVQHITQLGIKAFWMSDVHKHGIPEVLNQILEYLPSSSPLHLSFDIDSLDPCEAPSTGFPEADGLSLEQAELLATTIRKTGRMVSMDLVEVNPGIGDQSDIDKTIGAGISIICKAFGGNK